MKQGQVANARQEGYTRRALLVALPALFAAYAAASILDAQAWADALSPLLCLVAAASALPNIAKARGIHRVRWILMGLAPFFWALGEGLWALWPFIAGRDQGDSVFLLIVYGSTNAIIAIIVVYFSLKGRKAHDSLQYFVDCGAVLAVALAFAYYVLLDRDLGALSHLSPNNLNSLVNLCLDIIIQTLILSNFLDWKRSDKGSTAALLSAAVFVFCCADGLFIYQEFYGLYKDNNVADLLYLLAMALFGWGAANYDPTVEWSEATHLAHDIGRSTTWKGIVLLLVPACLSFVKGVRAEQLAYFIAIGIVYQAASSTLRRLRDKSREARLLEEKVRERTAELERANAELERVARTDEVTGLCNRTHFIKLLDEAIDSLAKAKNGEAIWLLIMDIDRFKSINDSYGHDLGDEVLREITRRLGKAVAPASVVARLGGDEFGVFCRKGAFEGVEPGVSRIAAAIGEPFSLGHLDLHVELSMGAAAYPEDAASRSDLMRAADMALYRAKTEGTRPIAYFDASLSSAIERRHQIEFALRGAAIGEEFTVFYQPQFAIDGKRLIGMEALLRWDSPALGRVGPAEFIPVAEESGIIIPLSDWMTREALLKVKEWNSRLGLDLVMSVNVSPVQLDDVRCISKLEGLLAELEIPSSWLKIEITEGVAMKDEEGVLAIFQRLEAMGIALAVDDFGTGYSSLSYLKKYNVDYLKIAKELVDETTTDRTAEQLAAAIVSMARALGIKTIAEGVEDERQFALLERMGCDEIQGYYLGRPLPAAEFERRFLG